MSNYYAVLGLDSKCSEADIKKVRVEKTEIFIIFSKFSNFSDFFDPNNRHIERRLETVTRTKIQMIRMRRKNSWK